MSYLIPKPSSSKNSNDDIYIYIYIYREREREREKLVDKFTYRGSSVSSTEKDIDTNYTATYLPSRKLSKLDGPDTQDTAGEAGTSS